MDLHDSVFIGQHHGQGNRCMAGSLPYFLFLKDGHLTVINKLDILGLSNYFSWL